MKWLIRENIVPVASGFGVLAWVLSFPFYGALAFILLENQAVWGTHSFVLGLALGFFLFAFSRLPVKLPVRVAAPVAVALVLLAVSNKHMIMTILFMFMGGMAASVPMIIWAMTLGGMEKPVPPFLTALILSSLWCVVTYLPLHNLQAVYLMAGAASLFFIAASGGLKNPDPAGFDQPLPWDRLMPVLLFIIVTSWAGGLLHRAFLPAMADWPGIAWLSFWPYIAALIPAGILARRHYEPLATLSLSTLGLALLALAVNNSAAKLLGFIGTLVGAAFADAFIWLSLIYFVYRGYPAALGIGLGINVLVIWLVGVTADLVYLSHPLKLPLAALSGASLLFILIPVILQRLPVSAPGRRVNEQTDAPNVSLDRTIPGKKQSRELYTPAETRVLDLLLEGRKNKEIAEELFISLNTVKFHVRNILRKSNCSSRRELIEKLPPAPQCPAGESPTV